MQNDEIKNDTVPEDANMVSRGRADRSPWFGTMAAKKNLATILVPSIPETKITCIYSNMVNTSNNGDRAPSIPGVYILPNNYKDDSSEYPKYGANVLRREMALPLPFHPLSSSN